MDEHLPNWLLRWFVTSCFYFIFVWKRLIRGSGKPGKLREFNFVEFVSTLSKPTWKMKHTNSILEYSEYFCQISSKSLLVILSYTVLKFRRFFETQCIYIIHCVPKKSIPPTTNDKCNSCCPIPIIFRTNITECKFQPTNSFECECKCQFSSLKASKHQFCCAQ